MVCGTNRGFWAHLVRWVQHTTLGVFSSHYIRVCLTHCMWCAVWDKAHTLYMMCQAHFFLQCNNGRNNIYYGSTFMRYSFYLYKFDQEFSSNRAPNTMFIEKYPYHAWLILQAIGKMIVYIKTLSFK